MKRAEYEELLRAREEVALAARSARHELDRKARDHLRHGGPAPAPDEIARAEQLERIAHSIGRILETVTVID